MKNLIQSIFGSKKDRDVKQLWPYVSAINEEYDKITSLSDDDLRAASQDIRQRTEHIVYFLSYQTRRH